jgi:hypothetical protein
MLNKITSAVVGYGFLAAVAAWMAWMLYGCAEDVVWNRANRPVIDRMNSAEDALIDRVKADGDAEDGDAEDWGEDCDQPYAKFRSAAASHRKLDR